MAPYGAFKYSFIQEHGYCFADLFIYSHLSVYVIIRSFILMEVFIYMFVLFIPFTQSLRALRRA